MAFVIGTFVEFQNRDKAHVGGRDIKDVGEGELVTRRHEEVDSPPPDSVEGRPSHPFDSEGGNRAKRFEVRPLR